MQKDDFLRLQFTTLREEIKETQKRIYLILALSALGVPPIQTVALKFEIQALIFGIPIVVFAFMILFTEENAAMMRCGQYIREHVEPAVDGVVGWEQWLEEGGTSRRSSNIYVAVCAYFVLFAHYLVAVSAAAGAGGSELWRGLAGFAGDHLHAVGGVAGGFPVEEFPARGEYALGLCRHCLPVPGRESQL